ncbi:MAG TPA: hypothetical protein DDW65_13775 [Firmicutes bacterium]|nr:hypothetical protein [Bacillota bacterium]
MNYNTFFHYSLPFKCPLRRAIFLITLRIGYTPPSCKLKPANQFLVSDRTAITDYQSFGGLIGS